MMDTIFPMTSLVAEHRELGLVVAVLIGFGFGFVLERSGFGQAPNLAAQFYLRDMRVFKVMFSAIVTAMLGVVLAAGLGLADLSAISASAVSFTYIWPQLVGGVLLGVGFIISGYCPGTSAVATASGNIDGAVAFVGVILGSVLFGEVYSASEAVRMFHASGNQENLFLYDLLGLPPSVLALGITVMAIGMFLGGEQVERLMAKKRGEDAPDHALAARPRKLAFSGMGVVAVLGLATLAMEGRPTAAAAKKAEVIAQHDLARRVIDEPWTLRILDMRAKKACEKKRIPGAECTPPKALKGLGLPYTAGERDLILVSDAKLAKLPEPAANYPGRVMVLDGGFDGWRAYALTQPAAPKAGADAAAMDEYRFRSGLYSVLTGVKPPPPPKPAGGVKFVPKKKKKGGGGCG